MQDDGCQASGGTADGLNNNPPGSISLIWINTIEVNDNSPATQPANIALLCINEVSEYKEPVELNVGIGEVIIDSGNDRYKDEKKPYIIIAIWLRPEQNYFFGQKYSISPYGEAPVSPASAIAKPCCPVWHLKDFITNHIYPPGISKLP